jgi:hypothetical protein
MGQQQLKNLLRIEDKATVIGHSGSGKTTFMKQYLAITDLRPIFVIDPIGNFSGPPNWKKYEYSGTIPCANRKPGQTCIKLSTPMQLEALVRYLGKKHPQWFLVIDEVDRFTDVNHLDYYTKRYLEEGRNWKRGGMFSVRRLGFLNKSILSNSRFLVMFRVNNASDLKYLSQLVDFPVEMDYSDEHSFYLFDLYRSENLGEYVLRI